MGRRLWALAAVVLAASCCGAQVCAVGWSQRRWRAEGCGPLARLLLSGAQAEWARRLCSKVLSSVVRGTETWLAPRPPPAAAAAAACSVAVAHPLLPWLIAAPHAASLPPGAARRPASGATTGAAAAGWRTGVTRAAGGRRRAAAGACARAGASGKRGCGVLPSEQLLCG